MCLTSHLLFDCHLLLQKQQQQQQVNNRGSTCLKTTNTNIGTTAKTLCGLRHTRYKKPQDRYNHLPSTIYYLPSTIYYLPSTIYHHQLQHTRTNTLITKYSRPNDLLPIPATYLAKNHRPTRVQTHLTSAEIPPTAQKPRLPKDPTSKHSSQSISLSLSKHLHWSSVSNKIQGNNFI